MSEGKVDSQATSENYNKCHGREECRQENGEESTGNKNNSRREESVANLAQEILRRKNLEFEFRQESMAKSATDMASKKRRLSTGELDRIKRLKEARKSIEKSSRKYSNERHQIHNKTITSQIDCKFVKAKGNHQNEANSNNGTTDTKCREEVRFLQIYKITVNNYSEITIFS